ncbi:MAG: tetratricopeptide repeat protein [Acidobacteriota bacterium]|nr:tetratricopeptide repeat protein [Acidobacteriota bacterium]
MVKKTACVMMTAGLFWSCASVPVQPPSFHIESIPSQITSRMSLDERIIVEDAWRDLRNGQGVRAERSLRRLDPSSPIYGVGIGYVYFLHQDLAAAADFFEAAARSDPDMIPARIGLAQIYEIQGRDEEVFSQYREILKVSPDHPWVVPRFESLRRRITDNLFRESETFAAAGKTEAARKSLLRLLFYHPESTEAQMELARLYLKDNNPQSAILHLESVLSLEPGHTGLLKIYAEALFQAEHLGRSLETYEKIRTLDPGDKETAARIETLKTRLGIFELPSMYDAIPAKEAVAREDVAALISVRFSDQIRSDLKPPIIVDIATSWASRFIMQTTALRFQDIYDNHTFQPRKTVSRAEMADTLMRLIRHLETRGHRLVKLIPPDRIQISDVGPEHLFHQPITEVIAYQIMDLSPDRQFLPDRPVSGPDAVRSLDIIKRLIR